MRYSATILLVALLLFSGSTFAQSGETITTTTTTTTTASDDLAIGDPLGNRGLSPKADAGPANTQSYCPEGSAEEHCVRAARRHTTPTTWQHDCATGLSQSCTNR